LHHFALFVLTSLAFWSGPVWSAISVIRDAEIEGVINQIATPLFRSAGLDKQLSKIYIINSQEINAGVTADHTMLINTGLLDICDDVATLAAVIAHEVAHMRGQHIVQGAQNNDKLSLINAASVLLGVGAAVVTGNSSVATAPVVLALHSTYRESRRYSREHEERADLEAIKLLEQAGYSVYGMLRSMKKMMNPYFDRYIGSSDTKYDLTHPLMAGRVAKVAKYIDHHKCQDTPHPLQAKFTRAMVKLAAFTKEAPIYDARFLASQIKTSNKGDDLYKQAIVNYRFHDLSRAISILDKLAAIEPDNGYVYELKAQILFENGQISASMNNYHKAISLLPKEPLLKTELAIAELHNSDNEDRTTIESAINNLKVALATDPQDIFVIHQLAAAYGKIGEFAISKYYLAEEALLQGDKKKAKKLAQQAKTNIAKDSIFAYQVQDLLNSLEEAN
jgi:predicted Zn-dependent protease